MRAMTRSTAPRRVFSKLAVCVLVVGLLLLGVVGLILPIIPGILCLALAAVIVARSFPWLDARLRRHRTLGPHLHRVDVFLTLSLPRKLQVAGLYGLKLLFDGLAALLSLGKKCAQEASRISSARST